MFVEPDERDPAIPLVAVYMLPGYVTHMSTTTHRDRLRALFRERDAGLPGFSIVVFSFEDCHYVAPDVLEVLGMMVEELIHHEVEVFLLGFHVQLQRTLRKTAWYRDVRHFDAYADVLHFLRTRVRDDGVYCHAPYIRAHVRGDNRSGGSSGAQGVVGAPNDHHAAQPARAREQCTVEGTHGSGSLGKRDPLPCAALGMGRLSEGGAPAAHVLPSNVALPPCQNGGAATAAPAVGRSTTPTNIPHSVSPGPWTPWDASIVTFPGEETRADTHGGVLSRQTHASQEPHE
ncbi:hypothetical protein EON62_00165 [archaeon]|nr:MAG: hypothetical protein EON62_00165 [archaeon]